MFSANRGTPQHYSPFNQIKAVAHIYIYTHMQLISNLYKHETTSVDSGLLYLTMVYHVGAFIAINFTNSKPPTIINYCRLVVSTDTKNQVTNWDHPRPPHPHHHHPHLHPHPR